MGSIRGVRREKYRVRRILPTGRVSCSYCCKSYKCRVILAQHIRTTHLNHRVNCPVCWKQFVSVSVSVCNPHLKEVHRIVHAQFYVKLNNSTETNIAASSELSFEADQTFPCMANVLQLNENMTFGKHMIANHDIDVGQMLIRTTAFATIEYLNCIHSGCFTCGKFIEFEQIQCPYCINVHFCSERCSLNDTHRKKCDSRFSRTDCSTVRSVTEIIAVAFRTAYDMEALLEFCHGILVFNKKTKNCRPSYALYGEILQLKGHREQDHSL